MDEGEARCLQFRFLQRNRAMSEVILPRVNCLHQKQVLVSYRKTRVLLMSVDTNADRQIGFVSVRF